MQGWIRMIMILTEECNRCGRNTIQQLKRVVRYLVEIECLLKYNKFN